MNQGFQVELFSAKQPINVNSVVNQKISGSSQEKKEDFSAFAKKLMAQTDQKETGNEKRPDSKSATEEKIFGLVGLAVLLPNLMMEQNTAVADNLVEEASSELPGNTGVIPEEAVVLTTANEDSNLVGTEEPVSESNKAGKGLCAAPNADLEESGLTKDSAEATKTNSQAGAEESAVPGRTAAEEGNKVNSNSETNRNDGAVDSFKITTNTGLESMNGFNEEGLKDEGESADGQTTGQIRVPESKREKTEAGKGILAAGSYEKAAAGIKDEGTTGNSLKGDFNSVVDFKTSADFTDSTRISQVETSEADFAANMADRAQLEEKVVRQIMNGTRIMVKDGVAKVDMHLEPKELGKLELSLVIDRDTVIAKFVAESKTVQAIIESNLDNLRTSLQDAGLKAEMLQVGVETGGFGHQEQRALAFGEKFKFAETEISPEEAEEFQVMESQGWGRVDFRA